VYSVYSVASILHFYHGVLIIDWKLTRSGQ
jgi:hypothetical protein